MSTIWWYDDGGKPCRVTRPNFAPIRESRQARCSAAGRQYRAGFSAHDSYQKRYSIRQKLGVERKILLHADRQRYWLVHCLSFIFFLDLHDAFITRDASDEKYRDIMKENPSEVTFCRRKGFSGHICELKSSILPLVEQFCDKSKLNDFLKLRA